MWILIECEDGKKRVRKKASVKDVYADNMGRTLISFYGKDLCSLKSKLNPEEFFKKHS